MSDMIRKNLSDDEAVAQPIWPLYVLALSVIIALASGILAVLNATTLGWPAFLLLAGVASISLMTMFVLVFGRPDDRSSNFGRADVSETVMAAFDQLTEPSLITQNGKPIYANQAYHDLAARLEAKGLSQSPPTVDRLFGTRIKSASAVIFRLHHRRREGERAEEYIESKDAAGNLIRYRVRVNGTKDGLVWQVKDMSASGQQAIDSLIEAPVGLFSVTPDGNILAINSVLRRWIGIGPSETIENMSDFVENPLSLLQSPQTHGRIVRNDTRLITQKGIVTPAVMTGVWQELEGGGAFASVAIYGHSGTTAIARQANLPGDPHIERPGAMAPQASHVSGDVNAAAPFAVARLDSLDLRKAIIMEANSALVGMSSGHAQAGDKFAALFAAGIETDAFLASDKPNRTLPYDAVLAGDAKCPVNVYVTEDDIGCVVYIVDVSARKDLENQLFQSQKMQAIGQFAGGVAHDFNNLLTAIRLNTDELLGRHPVGDPSYGELLNINTTVTRAAALVKKLLQFSRKQTQRTQVLGVTDTLSDLYMLLKQVLNERVTLEMVHGRDLPSIRVDESQIETALINLCVNARDAMEDQGKGSITISTHIADGSEIKNKGLENVKDGKFVRIDVTDTGTGMDAKTQDKIFEPFFTTKDVGKGTGLGLATVYGIVQQSSGFLTVESQLGKGTTFHIYLPATEELPDSHSPSKIKSKAASKKPSDLAGQGTILFVEDEDNVREIAAKTLRKRGYKVIEACDGEEAYEILEAGEHSFDLMVSDVVMPGMDGPTLLKKGRPLLGDARIVFISGYAQEEFSDILSEEKDITFLPKPFTLLQLAQRVKTELGG